MPLTILDHEIEQCRLYEAIKRKFGECLQGKVPFKKIASILLRYTFNRIQFRRVDIEPIFFVIENKTELKIVEDQLITDLELYKIDKTTIANLLERLNEEWINAAKQLANLLTVQQETKTGLIVDPANEHSSLFAHDVYFNSLTKMSSPTVSKYNAEEIVALKLRYNYLELKNHGLARDYEELGYTRRGPCLEAFASASNHYFDNYCSAFPDLESCLGSLGSFFQEKCLWDNPSLNACNKVYTVFINPPFDETLITRAVDKVLSWADSRANSQINNAKKSQYSSSYLTRNFLFTLPNWKNFPILDRLKLSVHTVRVNNYKEGVLKFLDYDNFKRHIYPCDITEIFVSVTF